MNLIDTSWTPNLAYGVGLITTDGCLSSDGKYIDLTSKDLDQIINFAKILGLQNKIGIKFNGYSDKKYFHIQFGNISFYRFLVQIGLSPRKSKTLTALLIPDNYFPDFLRGCLDGDGCTYSYFDPRWKSSFMLYTQFVSASKKHLEWLNKVIYRLFKIRGKINSGGRVYKLRYAKASSLILLKKTYYRDDLICLERKTYIHSGIPPLHS